MPSIIRYGGALNPWNDVCLRGAEITDSDLFDTALEKVIGTLRTDGSFYASPSLTARMIWLLGLPDSPIIVPITAYTNINVSVVTLTFKK